MNYGLIAEISVFSLFAIGAVYNYLQGAEKKELKENLKWAIKQKEEAIRNSQMRGAKHVKGIVELNATLVKFRDEIEHLNAKCIDYENKVRLAKGRKLDCFQVKEVFDMRDTGMSVRQIAGNFNVSRQTIRNILRRKGAYKNG